MTTINETVNEIHAQMQIEKSKHPLQSVNSFMREKLESLAKKAKSKREFKALVVSETPYNANGFKECAACQYLASFIK